MTRTATPARLFGRCPERGCATRVVLHPGDAAVDNGWVVVDLPDRGTVGTGGVVARGLVYCAGHLIGLRFDGVRGTFNAMECGPRCWNGTAPECKCACGGAHHGEQG